MHTTQKGSEGFTVIMPTYNQAGFIRNALRSVLAQTYQQWELIIVNDGCTDETERMIADYLADPRIVYLRSETNEGLGAAVNKALDMARYDLIAYLPSDDFYFENHLQVVKEKFDENEEIVLVYTDMRSEICDSLLNTKNAMINGLVAFEAMQMVQVAHRKTSERWATREEYVSEDLYKTFWYKLTGQGRFAHVVQETCNWTVHPDQRHKIIDERLGGNINKYRSFYKVRTPIRMKVSRGKFVDEYKQYAAFRKTTPKKPDGLKILLVGELSYNPERIFALQEAGHTLYGLWTPEPRFTFSNVGPLPFGDVETLNNKDWEKEIERIKPDIIYALLNFCAVPFAHEVLCACPNIPFVWHFKEGPFLCFEHGMWKKLMDLFLYSDGQIFLNEIAKRWYEQYLPPSLLSITLDGDLPKREYFSDDFTQKLSGKDGELHTVVSGRMIGMDMDLIKALADKKVHVHLYTESYEECISQSLEEYERKAHGYFHLHPHCGANQWTSEYSRYDAGWLHCIQSQNKGDYSRMGWNDLNIPARVSTMMAAGLPCIQYDNSEHVVAMQSCVRDIDCGIFFKDATSLARQLKNKTRMAELRENVLKHRMEFCFDTHVETLTRFFEEVIRHKRQQ